MSVQHKGELHDHVDKLTAILWTHFRDIVLVLPIMGITMGILWFYDLVSSFLNFSSSFGLKWTMDTVDVELARFEFSCKLRLACFYSMSRTTADAATKHTTTTTFDSSYMVVPKLRIKIPNARFLDVSVIPGATWRWKYCWVSCAGFSTVDLKEVWLASLAFEWLASKSVWWRFKMREKCLMVHGATMVANYVRTVL